VIVGLSQVYAELPKNATVGEGCDLWGIVKRDQSIAAAAQGTLI